MATRLSEEKRMSSAPDRSSWAFAAAALVAAFALLFGDAGEAGPIDVDEITFGVDIVFPATEVEGLPAGIHHEADIGPGGGPYRRTRFFSGVLSTEGEGLWIERNNVWCLSYNLDHCTGVPLLPDTGAFHWTWEASYKPTESTPALIENNVDVRYGDGTWHRPWALHVDTENQRANLHFLPAPGVEKFQINQNGNVVIGTPFRQPVRQLEVVGDALFTRSVQVDGTLTVSGRRVLTESTSAAHGVLRWGISDGAGLASAHGVCKASGLACEGAVLPDGSRPECEASHAPGTVFFALCR